jgi:SWI/SNF-related matrix-associated actin-dependent regulator 1 of chromatin subfamily A
MSFCPVQLEGTTSYIKVDHGIHIYTYDRPFRVLRDMVKPVKTIISESTSDGLPTWKVSVFSIYPWMFNTLKERLPELEPYCDQVMSSIESKDYDSWPEYKANESWFPYQKEGVEWLLMNKGGMVCDEMGLGKTIQAIGYIQNSPFEFALVVAPASMIYTWKREIEKWSDWTGVVLNGKKIITKTLKQEVDSWNSKTVFIMSWSSIALYEKKILEWDVSIDCMICDESHYAKGMNAKRTKAVMTLSKVVSSTVLLSGTPMRNCSIDLFPQLHMVAPDKYPDFFEFAERYSPPRERTFGRTTVLVYDQSTNLPELRQKVKEDMVFRKKKDVLHDLPSKRYRRIDIETPSWIQKEWEDIISSVKNGEQIDAARMIQHRQDVGLHKAESLIDWIEDNSSPKEPIVIFIVHKDIRRLLESSLKKKDISVGCIVGDIPNKKREQTILEFQRGNIQVLICSEAGKEGITLTKSSSLIQLERFWVPADEEQAEARIWRIGQRNKVIISQAHMSKTIDDFIVGKLIRKRNVIDEVFSDHSMDEETFALLDRMFDSLF